MPAYWRGDEQWGYAPPTAPPEAGTGTGPMEIHLSNGGDVGVPEQEPNDESPPPGNNGAAESPAVTTHPSMNDICDQYYSNYGKPHFTGARHVANHAQIVTYNSSDHSPNQKPAPILIDSSASCSAAGEAWVKSLGNSIPPNEDRRTGVPIRRRPDIPYLMRNRLACENAQEFRERKCGSRDSRPRRYRASDYPYANIAQFDD